MIKKQINQNDNFDLELLNSIECNYVFNEKPQNRLIDKTNKLTDINNNKLKQLEDLKNEINSIKNCKLKENANYAIIGNGNIESQIMIIGGAPGKSEDLSNSVYTGNDGNLLEKMLIAIKIKKQNVYITYAVNYRPPDDRKPSKDEIKKYKLFLEKHISIINPKLLIMMGSTAMESLTGINSNISMERGKWKDIIVKNTSYKGIITFDPSYLLRHPENKKNSWEDLKNIRKKIEELNLNI
jgi:uracil-DNA glycosylase